MALPLLRMLGLLAALGTCAAACAPEESSGGRSENDVSGSEGRGNDTSGTEASPEGPSGSTQQSPSPSTSTTPPPPSGTCDPTNCADGCCVGNQCFTDHAPYHCATGGVACPAPCAAASSCVQTANTYACSAVVSGQYEVTLVGTTVRNGADGSGDMPDLYVNGGAFGTFVIPKTSTASNTLTATWNVKLGTADANVLVGKTVSIEIKDSDSFSGDTMIGTCTHTLTAADIGLGALVIQDAECSDYIVSVSFALKKLG